MDIEEKPDHIDEVVKQLEESKVEETKVCKSSDYPEHEEVYNYLKHLLTSDPYNKFCVDCHHNQSTHANISYGTFICASCAGIHQVLFGKSKSYTKDIFNEHWDDYQLQAVSAQFGGNKRFFEFIKTYEVHLMPIAEKYKHKSSKYHSKKMAALLDGKNFTELPPVKNWNEALVRAQSKVIGAVETAES